MKFSKILLFAVLTMVLVLSLAACGAKATPEAEAPAEEAAVEAPAAEVAEEAEAEEAAEDAPMIEGCLGTAEDAIVDLECREVTIAVENAYPPFNYIDPETGEAGGWDYDVMDEICARLHCTPVYVEAAWDGMIAATAEGQFDIAGDGITITEDRAEIVAFSNGYVALNQVLLVRADEDRFASMDEIAADDTIKFATQVNTTNYETAATYLSEDRIEAYDTFPFAVQALIAGDTDAILIDEIPAVGYIAENEGLLKVVGDPVVSDELGFAFPLGSDLVDPVNQALAAMEADGVLADLNNYYFDPNWVAPE